MILHIYLGYHRRIAIVYATQFAFAIVLVFAIADTIGFTFIHQLFHYFIIHGKRKQKRCLTKMRKLRALGNKRITFSFVAVYLMQRGNRITSPGTTKIYPFLM